MEGVKVASAGKTDASLSSVAAAAGVTSSTGTASNQQQQQQQQQQRDLQSVPATDDAVLESLAQCEWRDKTLWIARQVLGGQSLNGFLKATATVQRIKRQRARQTNSTKAKQQLREQQAAAVKQGLPDAPGINPLSQQHNDDVSVASSTDASKKRDAPGVDDENETELKLQIMNPRTAKKLKSEMEAGIQFCEALHNVICGTLVELGPAVEATGFEIPPPLGAPATTNSHTRSKTRGSMSIPTPKANVRASSTATSSSNLSKSPPGTPSRPSLSDRSSSTARAASVKSPETPSSNARTSTLRRNRKKKLPPSGEPIIQIPEFDSSGKRICSKREHNNKILEVLQYRSLRQGDPVAAKVSSRDLWILARVLRDHPVTASPVDLLEMHPSKRSQLFKETIMVMDVEDNGNAGAAPTPVPRNAILPLPRSCSEAAEWCSQFYRKGSRVFAMYPDTTSLYSATVIDSTTYCQDNDDIVVV